MLHQASKRNEGTKNMVATPCEDSEMSVDNTIEELANFHSYEETSSPHDTQLHLKSSGRYNNYLLITTCTLQSILCIFKP